MVSNVIGCAYDKSIVAGVDAAGAPALYFGNTRGVYHLSTQDTLELISRPIDDLWDSPTNTFAIFHGHSDQVWFYKGSLYILVYHTRTGGWSRYGSYSLACGAMFPDLVLSGSDWVQDASPEFTLKPFYFHTTSFLYKHDDTTTNLDEDLGYRAYITSRPYFPAGLGSRVLTHDAVLMAEASSATTITLTVDRDFGSETKTATASLTADGTETRGIRRMGDSGFGSLASVQFTLGDADTTGTTHWELDALSVPLKAQESLS